MTADVRKQGVGGEGGIRTHGTGEGTTVFETVPIDHSGTSPVQVEAPYILPRDGLQLSWRMANQLTARIASL
jgi:hypothetical protein